MQSVAYRNHVGLNTSHRSNDTNAISAYFCDNYIPGRVRGRYVKRKGSKVSDIAGEVTRGLGGYFHTSTDLTSKETIIRVQFDYSNFRVDEYDWVTEAFSEITTATTELGTNVAFSATSPAYFAQQNELMVIAAGGCLTIRESSGALVAGRLGGDFPASALTAVTNGAGVLTGDPVYVVTFYDSVTGWESSPSPTVTVAVSSEQVQLGNFPGFAAANHAVTNYRIYRTVMDGTGDPLLLATVAEVSTYDDNNADTVLLSTVAPESIDHDPPPSDVWVASAFKNRFWVASGDKVYYSHPYTGSLASLEYFSSDRYFQFPRRVTGLTPSSDFGELLVFQPPGHGVYKIAPFTDGTFAEELKFPSEGTKFAHSVSSNETDIVWWGSAYPRMIRNGQLVTGYSDAFRNSVRGVTTEEADQDFYVWTVWNPDLAQFIHSITALDQETQRWVDAATLASEEWEDVATSATVEWQLV